MIGGIKISEANLLAHTTVMSCIFLLTVLLAIWALIVFCKGNDKENKDVYMVALRDEGGTLIGYYEKHEYRNRETKELYQMD